MFGGYVSVFAGFRVSLVCLTWDLSEARYIGLHFLGRV
jgi:hypothetical protein